MSFPAYKGCKDSGIEKLGEVPLHWEVNQLRRGISFLTDFEANCSFSDMAKNTTFDKGEPFAWLVRATDLENRRYGICEGNRFCGEQTYKFLRKTSLHGGEFLVTKRGEIGKIYVVPDTGEPATLGPNLYLIKLNDKLDPEFAFYWFKGSFGNRQLKIRNQSTTIGALYKDDLRDCICVMPPPEEQKQIASFLDYETAKIDALIEKQQQLIALLGEKRQAVISHAVTKGLNPDAPMRDSGVEWLGQVPEHWEVTPLKYKCELIDGDRSSSYPSGDDLIDEGIPFVSSKNISEHKLTRSNLVCITKEKFDQLRQGKLEPNDLVITVRGTIGNVGVFDPNELGCDTAFINAQMMIMRPRRGLTEFLGLVSQSVAWQEQLDVAAYGSTVRQLSNQVLGNVMISIPPDQELAALVDQTKKTISKFNSLVICARLAETLLQERRTALISAAVTGKIDVRGWKPPSSAARLETEMEVA